LPKQGPLLLPAAVSGGWGWYDTERPISFPGFSALPRSDHDIGAPPISTEIVWQHGAAIESAEHQRPWA